MSFKYRTIGYSPEYAITTGSSFNDFHNSNNFQSGSTINLKLGSTTLAEIGALIRVTDAPTNTLDVTNKLYVDNRDALKLNLTGGTLTGELTLSTANFTQTGTATLSTGTGAVTLNGSTTLAATRTLTLSGDPTLPLQAATKQYADTKLPFIGGSLTGYLTLHDHPTTGFHAATKAYVDGRLSLVDAGDGLYKTSSTQNITGTYSQTATNITITTTNDHGFATGTVVNLVFTSGNPSAPTNGAYAVVSTSGPKIFAVVAADSVSRTGNVTTTVTFTGISIASTGTGALQVDDDAISLKVTNAVASNTVWYDQVRVDTFGRVSAAQNTPKITTNDGWYNRFHVQAGYVTQAESVNYLTANQTITLSGDVIGSGTTALAANLSVIPGLSAGSYTKVNVNDKGRVTAASQLSSSDITNALGYTPPRESTVEFIHLRSSFASNSWGTQPVNLQVVSGSIANSSISGSAIYVPRGVYQIVFYGANNWWSTYYSSWWWGGWWSNYWTYYYQPSVIWMNGTIQTATFSNSAGWWWYWNRSFYMPDRAQDFNITDVFHAPTDGSYFQFGMPLLAGVTFWYNVKIVKLR